MLERFVDQFFEEIGENPTLPEGGVYKIPHLPNAIYLSEVQGTTGIQLLLKTVIAPVPKDKERTLYLEKLLEGGLFGAFSGGFILGIDETRENATLSSELFLPSSYTEFRNRISHFSDLASDWSLL